MAAIKLPFKSTLDLRTDTNLASPSGTKIVLEHREEISLSGKRTLVKDRKVDIYEKIQASRESCEIQNILRRAAEGDTAVLNMVNGQYLDITGAPSSLAQAQQFVIRAKQEFDELPKDIRAKFDNNAEMYVAEYGTGSWEDKTGIKALREAKLEREKLEKLSKENMDKAFELLAQKGELINE